MKAVLMTERGGPEVLKIENIPVPAIKRGSELLVKVKAAGMNPVDIKQRIRGTWYPSRLPQILGLDGAGVVEEIGPEVKRFKPGDKIYFICGGFGKTPGTYAEYTVIDEWFAAIKPESLSFAEAAACPSSLITSWECLFDKGRLSGGDSVLIHAGAGGVGHLAVQLAHNRGSRVATTVVSKKQADIVKKLGAEKVIIVTGNDFVKEIMEWTEGKGVDLALDLVGGETFYRTFSCVKLYGTLIALLSPVHGAGDWTEARLRNLSIILELMLTPMYYDLIEIQLHHREILEECARLFDTEKLSVIVNRTFPLKDASEAHRLLEQGDIIGKIILLME
ncbi:MAG: zinc-dependent alcohol dehydrogenase family protein [Candidatus Jordarchaeum sp.]|uniref:zinc-dependent alcohol dehydrogenase family protein n=1 Tax=Candidatus Jordarchaeum sp. TaxID=2823881 RepID=UPI00404AC27B